MGLTVVEGGNALVSVQGLNALQQWCYWKERMLLHQYQWEENNSTVLELG